MSDALTIRIELPPQRLRLYDAAGLKNREDGREEPAANGAGEREGSNATPRGHHFVRAKIGAGAPVDAVFVGRRWRGECYSSALAAQYPARDWILARILWLCGREVGFNRLGAVDSMRRYIYIHGTPPSEPMSVPHSHGCVRMRIADVIELFDLVPAGTPVTIYD